MVIAYSLYHHITKIFFVYKQTNDRVTPQRLPCNFCGYWELPNNRIADSDGVTRRNPGIGWRTDINIDINPIEYPGVKAPIYYAFLFFSRAAGNILGAPIIYYARGAQGVLPMWVGGATSQLDLPSLTLLSVAGCGRLQLGVPH